MMEPQQALFTAVRGKLLESYPDSVYDGQLPGADTPYPFIYLGEFVQYDSETKSVILGNIPVTIHVWHCDFTKRGTVSAMLSAVKSALRSATCTDYSFMVRNATTSLLCTELLRLQFTFHLNIRRYKHNA